MERTYYDILGISSTEKDKEKIKKEYRKLARKYHPDANPGDEDAKRNMQEVNEAYETLMDDEKRAKYDEKLTGRVRNPIGNETLSTWERQEITRIFFEGLDSANTVADLLQKVLDKINQDQRVLKVVNNLPNDLDVLKQLNRGIKITFAQFRNAGIRRVVSDTVHRQRQAFNQKTHSNAQPDNFRSNTTQEDISRRERLRAARQVASTLVSTVSSKLNQYPKEANQELLAEARRRVFRLQDIVTNQSSTAEQLENATQAVNDAVQKLDDNLQAKNDEQERIYSEEKRAERQREFEERRKNGEIKAFETAVENARDFEELFEIVTEHPREKPDLMQWVDGLENDQVLLETIVDEFYDAPNHGRQFWKDSEDEDFSKRGFEELHNDKIRQKAKRLYVDEMKKLLRREVAPYSREPKPRPFKDVRDFCQFLAEDVGAYVSMSEYDRSFTGRVTLHGKEVADRILQILQVIENPDLDWDELIKQYASSNRQRLVTYPRLKNYKTQELFDVQGLPEDYGEDSNIRHWANELLWEKVKHELEEILLDSTTLDELLEVMPFFNDDEIDRITEFDENKSKGRGNINNYAIKLHNAMVHGLEDNWGTLREKRGLFGGFIDIKSDEEMISVIQKKTGIDNPYFAGLIVDILERDFKDEAVGNDDVDEEEEDYDDKDDEDDEDDNDDEDEQK